MGGARRGAAARGSAASPRRVRGGRARWAQQPSSFHRRPDPHSEIGPTPHWSIMQEQLSHSLPSAAHGAAVRAASESVQPGAGVHLVWSPSPGKDAVRPRTPGDRGQGTGDGLPSRHHPPRSVVRRALGAGRAFCGPEPCALGPGPSPSLSSSLPLSSSSSPSPSSGIPQEARRSLSGGGEGGSRVTTETPRFSIRAAAGPSSAARVLPAAGRRPAVPAQARPGLPTCTPSSPGSGRTRSPWAAEVGSLRGEKLRSFESDESVTRGSPCAQLPRLCQRRRRSTPGRGALGRLSQDRTAGFYDAGRLCRLPAGPNLPQCASN